jgi:hypothetical protein
MCRLQRLSMSMNSLIALRVVSDLRETEIVVSLEDKQGVGQCFVAYYVVFQYDLFDFFPFLWR